MNPVKAYLSRIGRKGGKVRSEAKAAAVRANGRKGGRPKGRPRQNITEPTERWYDILVNGRPE